MTAEARGLLLDLQRMMARCDAEIAAMRTQTDAPAWLITLGIEDWAQEKRLLAAELARRRDPDAHLGAVE